MIAFLKRDSMNAQRTLPFSNPTTSKDAAKSMEKRAPIAAAVIYSTICDWGAPGSRGLTCDEVECIKKISHQTASARIRDLARIGMIVDSGERRKTRSGRNAIVWRKK